MLTTKDIERRFLSYFASQGHVIMEGSSLIGDSSLMFTNSGMVQFKEIFTGRQKPKVLNAATVQNCVRAGGKHNDLDNVGYTRRHHTFFQMLGNFSFGGYFKEQAIKYAWEFLATLGIDKSRLYITVYHTDDESFQIWRRLTGWGEERIIKINTQDNFWSMGELGPCGPCSEIFYDHGPEVEGGLPGTPNADGDRFVEIWNMVFMEYERVKNDLGEEVLQPLPVKCIDTGMGLERLAAVIQSTCDNYEIDIFKDIICKIKTQLGWNSSSIDSNNSIDDLNNQNNLGLEPSLKIVADHLRSMVFLMLDGVLPSNEGRGYVLRRIIRRAGWHLQLLNEYTIKIDPKYNKAATLNSFVIDVCKIMDISPAQANINTIIHLISEEESRFYQLISKAQQVIASLLDQNPHMKQLDADTGFMLYDTHGFPLDLIKSILDAKGVKFDEAGFEDAMAKQKLRGKNSWSGNKEGSTKSEVLLENIIQDIGNICTEFVGYETFSCNAKIIGLVLKDQMLNECALEQNTRVDIITDRTPFYAEGGGQVGDIGIIYLKNFELQVVDTKKVGDIYIHSCIYTQSNQEKIIVGDVVRMQIDKTHRHQVQRHHTATHLLHAVLRHTLGEQISQRGSYVGYDRLTFDFNHAPIKQEVLDQIELEINKIIFSNCRVESSIQSLADAKNNGAICLFGDKYEDEVRVIRIANSLADLDLEKINNIHEERSPAKEAGCSLNIQEAANDQVHSMELCGGTHVKFTGEIGIFKILSEKSIGSGIRRIEAVCGIQAYQMLQSSDMVCSSAASLLGTAKEHVIDKIISLQADIKGLMKDKLSLKLSACNLSEVSKISIQDIEIYIANLDEDIDFLKAAAEKNAESNQNAVVIYLNQNKFVARKNKLVKMNLRKVMDAVLAKLPNAKGGGNENMYQGSIGLEAINLEQFKPMVFELIQDILKNDA